MVMEVMVTGILTQESQRSFQTSVIDNLKPIGNLAEEKAATDSDQGDGLEQVPSLRQKNVAIIRSV